MNRVLQKSIRMMKGRAPHRSYKMFQGNLAGLLNISRLSETKERTNYSYHGLCFAWSRTDPHPSPFLEIGIDLASIIAFMCKQMFFLGCYLQVQVCQQIRFLWGLPYYGCPCFCSLHHVSPPFLFHFLRSLLLLPFLQQMRSVHTKPCLNWMSLLFLQGNSLFYSITISRKDLL